MAIAAPARADPVTGYAEGVAGGSVLAGPWVRLAAQRHLRDLEEARERGLVWDPDAAAHALDFFGHLRLPEATVEADDTDVDSHPFALMDFQRFIVGSVFGWYRDDDTRRFRTAYVESGKGSGKTPLAGGIGLYGLVADEQPAAEVYTAGVSRDQAAYLFRDARSMALASPAIRARAVIDTHNIAVPRTNSFMRPVSSEGRSLDQKRVHISLIDEIHEHRSAVVVNKMRAGTKGRRNALIVEITNSGYDRHSICWQHHEYSIKVLQGVIENDSWFAYVCALDEGDAWTDPAVWPKVNPGLGVTITQRYLEEQVAEAVGMPANESLVKRLNFCIWTESSAGWFDMERWDAGSAEPQIVTGQRVWGGLDLASTTDIAALALISPTTETVRHEPEPGLFEDAEVLYLDVLMRFWVPREAIIRRSERDHVPYDRWEREGHITATEGNEIDQETIRLELLQLADDYELVDSGLDRWNSTYLRQRLEDEGFTFTLVGQGFQSLTEPSKRLEAMVAGVRIRHGGNPVLRWMASNVVAETDAAGNIKPSRRHSTEKIDGIAALVTAIAAWLATPGEAEGSAYEEYVEDRMTL